MKTIISEVLASTEICCMSCQHWQRIDETTAQRKEHRCELCAHVITDREWYTRADEFEQIASGEAYHMAMMGGMSVEQCLTFFKPGNRPPEQIEAGSVECPHCKQEVILRADAVAHEIGPDGLERAVEYGPGEGVCCHYLFVNAFDGFRLYHLPPSQGVK